MGARPFVLFGPDHLAAIAATGVVAAGLSTLARGDPGGRRASLVRLGLAGTLAAAVVAGLWGEARRGRLSVWDVFPLNLCDLAIVLAVFALWTRRQTAYELLYFWALAGTLFAMITPDLAWGFPSRHFVSFFAFHGSVVAAALFLTLGMRMRPRPGAPWRVFAWTNLYAAIAGIVDAAFGKNYLYLREKPEGPSALDWLGPWPWYILGAEVLALGLFLLLDSPFRRVRRS